MESLGHGHGGVGVGVKQLFVEWGEEDIDSFRVQLLEGLQLLRVERAQGRQRGNPANQLPSKTGRSGRLENEQRAKELPSPLGGAGQKGGGLPWPECPRPCGSSA